MIGISLAIFGIFYTQEIEQNPQLSTEKDLSEDQKTWVEIESVQCDNRFGHSSSFESFFEKQGITIFDSKREERFKGNPYCEGCGCSSGYTLLFLVSDFDVEKMLEMGFTKSQ